MSKLAAAIAATSQKTGPVCSVALLSERLPKAERADLHAAIADPAIQASAIVRGLAAIGHKVDYTTLRRHRRGECACAHG